MSLSRPRRDRPLPLPLPLPSPTLTSPASLDRESIALPAHTRPSRDYPLSSSPTISAFHIQHIPSASPAAHSTTHAGGILPSASFFRPSRPPHSPPSSLASHSHSLPPPDSFSLSPIRPHPSHESDLRRVSDSPSLRRLAAPCKRSREPLIPLATKSPFSPPSKPSNSPHPSNNSSNRLVSGVARVLRALSLDVTGNPTPPSSSHQNLDLPQPAHHPSQCSPPHPRAQIPSSGPPSSSPSPDNTFVHDPPNIFPPLSAIPLTPPKRVYELYPSRNRFFCAGRLLTGGDFPWAFIASLLLVIAISAAWFSTTCVWWWLNESPAVAAVGAYMCLLTISCMLTTAFRDPGILPRDLDPDPPLPATSPSDGGPRVPLPRDLKVRTDTVRVKYCLTCKTYRPPRSSHCRMCDNCVEACDHHCQWVNNCVGRRNYTFFFCFLFSAVSTLCLVICTSAIHLYLLTEKDHVHFYEALHRGVGSAVAFSLSILVVWPVTALLAYHMRLLLLNITTIEQIRNQAHKTLIPGARPPNPFSYGSWGSNLAEVLCRPAGLSWLNAHAFVTEDKRRVNPGLDDAGWENNDLGVARPADE